jgi:hypothetical protein
MLKGFFGGPKGFDEYFLDVAEGHVFYSELGHFVGGLFVLEEDFSPSVELRYDSAGDPVVGVYKKTFGIQKGINLGVKILYERRAIPIIVCFNILNDGLRIDATCLFLQVDLLFSKKDRNERGASLHIFLLKA